MTSQLIGRFARFFVVGASGVLVNMVVLILLTEGGGVPYTISSLLAIELSILSNFTLNNAWTWADKRTSSLRARLINYHLAAGITALSANWCMLVLLTWLFKLDYRLANLIGIAGGTILNFSLNHVWTFRTHSIHLPLNWSLPDWKRSLHRLSLGGISTRCQIVLITLLAAALGLRVAAMAGMTLVPEEAYYWMYSQHPSLSYYDHPPMVAWLIGLGTTLCGNTEFGVRLGGGLLMLMASVVMYVFGKIWFGRQAALLAALLLQALPVYFGAGLIATMDSALVFFWLVCLVGVSLALKENRLWGWYVAGVGLGGAMLSKYTGSFLALGMMMAVLAYPPWRRHVRSVHPYAAALLAFAMFAPVLVWNAQHGWASFRFQFAERFAGERFHARYVGLFVLQQLLVATPLVLAGMLWLSGRLSRSRRRLFTSRWVIVWCFSAPLLLVMGYKSLRYDIHLNWTLPLYLSVLPGVSQLGLASWRRLNMKRRGLGWSVAVPGTVVVCLSLNVFALVYVLTLEPRLGLITAVGPWRELARKVEAVEEQVEAETRSEPLIVADGKYRLASVLAFYRTPLEQEVRASDFTTSQWIIGGPGLSYPYWAKPDQWKEGDCVVVEEDDGLDKYAARFRELQLVGVFRLNHHSYYIGVGRGRLQ